MKFMMVFLVSIIALAMIIMVVAYFFQEKFIFFPEKLNTEFGYSFTDPFIERNFKIDDKVSINAVHFKTPDPKGIIFYFHGNAGSLLRWGEVAPDFLMLHYDILIVDYRGYGKSTGKISERGLYRDARVIYDSLKKEYPENRIIIYGRSIGTGIATWLASETEPGKLILESPFYSFVDIARHYYAWLPGWLLRYQFRSDHHIEKVKCRICIIHGSEDEIIPVNASYRLREKLKPGDEMVIVESGHHNDLSMFEEYSEFLKKCLEE